MTDILTLIDDAGASGAISSATAPLDLTGGVLSTAWKPSAVTAASGLFALANDSTGSLSLSLFADLMFFWCAQCMRRVFFGARNECDVCLLH